jgi:outer membrane protein assembly factor BamB
VDLATGQVRATAPDAVQLPPGFVNLGVYVMAFADTILVSYPALNGWTFSSFDPHSLARRWSVTLPTDRYTPVPCGSRVCIAASSGTAVLDAGTGRVVWRLPPGGFVSQLDDRYLIAEDKAGLLSVVHAASGRVELKLPGWALEFTDEGRPLLYQEDQGRHRTWVATLDGDPVGLRLLGWLPGAVQAADCASAGGYLLCRTVNQTMQVWRLTH